MKKLEFILLIAVCNLSSGCVYMLSPSSSRWLCFSDDQPFEKLCNKTVTLKRPIQIYSNVDLDKVHNDSATMSPCQLTGVPNKLPVGSKIILHSFHLNKDYVLIWIPVKIRYEVWFDVPGYPLPYDGHYIYIWGRGRYLHKAPWESENAPEYKYVGLNGKSYKKENN